MHEVKMESCIVIDISKELIERVKELLISHGCLRSNFIPYIDGMGDYPVTIYHKTNNIMEMRRYELLLLDAGFDVEFVEKTRNGEKDYLINIEDKETELEYSSEFWECPDCNNVQDIRTFRDDGYCYGYVLQHCECGCVFDNNLWTQDCS